MAFLEVDGRLTFILLGSCFIDMPWRMLEYTGDILGEYLDDLGVSYLRTKGSYNLGFIARNLLLDIFII